MKAGRLPAYVAPIADAACLMIFVAAGRESHDIGGGASWYLTVLWPFAAGWFALALADGLYVRRSKPWVRLLVTLAGGVAIALVLRAGVTQRSTPAAFVVVAYAFVALLTFGWRLLVAGVRSVLRGRGSDASSV